jgi:hypothetical protein
MPDKDDDTPIEAARLSDEQKANIRQQMDAAGTAGGGQESEPAGAPGGTVGYDTSGTEAVGPTDVTVRDQRANLRTEVASQSDVVDTDDVSVSQDRTDAGGVELEANIQQDAVKENLREDVAASNPGVDADDVAVQQQGDDLVAGTDVSGAEKITDPDAGAVTGSPTTQPVDRTEASSFDEPSLGDPSERERASPLAEMAISEDQRQRALEGSREQLRRANEGSVGATVAEIGRQTQEAGVGLREQAVDAIPGTDAGPRASFTSPEGQQSPRVTEQIASGAAGIATFPAVLAGGAIQATGQAVEDPIDLQQAQRLPGTTGEALESQGEFVTNRPVEAATIGAAAAAGSGAVRGSARSAAARGRAAARSAGQRARSGLETFGADTRAQTQLGRSQSRTRGQSESGGQSVSENAPVRRELTEGRRAGGRRAEESGTTVRGEPRTLDRAQNFAQRARERTRLQQPQAEATAQIRELSAPDARVTTSQSVRAGLPDEPSLQRDSQSVDARVFDGTQTESRVLDADDQTALEPRDPLQDPSIDRGGQQETTRVFDGDSTTAIARQRQAQRTVSDELGLDSRTGLDSDIGLDGDTGLDSNSRGRTRDRASQRDLATTAQTPDQSEELIGTPAGRNSTQTPIGRTTFTPTPRTPPRNPRNRRSPPLPLTPDVPGGSGAGGGATFAFSSDETFSSGIASFEDVFEDEDGEGRRRDDEESPFASGSAQIFGDGFDFGDFDL